MYHAGRFIPVRFLALAAHFVILVTLLWSLDTNLISCLPVDYTQEEYNNEDQNLKIGLSLSLVFIGLEVISFLLGISMFIISISLLSIVSHICAAVTLSLYIIESWKCSDFWYIFGFCSAFPGTIEIGAIIMFMLGKLRA